MLLRRTCLRLSTRCVSDTPGEATSGEATSGEATKFIKKDKQTYNARKRTLSNLQCLNGLLDTHSRNLRPQKPTATVVDSMEEDFFNVKSLFTLRELYDAKVHMGHHMGCWHESNRRYLFGVRNNMHIIDIAATEQHLWRALNVASCVALAGGRILFVDLRPGLKDIAEAAAAVCGESSQTTDTRRKGEMLHGVDDLWTTKPDLVICSNVNHDGAKALLLACNKYLVPSIGIVDSDVDPVNLTYHVPGNDDSRESLILYHKLFAKAIIQAKKSLQAAHQTEPDSMLHGKATIDHFAH